MLVVLTDDGVCVVTREPIDALDALDAESFAHAQGCEDCADAFALACFTLYHAATVGV